jgi:hypothetical protein
MYHVQRLLFREAELDPFLGRVLDSDAFAVGARERLRLGG